jgi:hypothetical protein
MKQAVIYSVKVTLTSALMIPLLINLLRYFFLIVNHMNPLQDRRVFHLLLNRLLRMTVCEIVLQGLLAVAIVALIRYLAKRNITGSKLKWYVTLLSITVTLLPYAIALCYALIMPMSRGIERIYLSDVTINGIIALSVVTISAWCYKLKESFEVLPSLYPEN